MHDPNTVAHEIKYPWFKHKPGTDKFWPEGYRETFITIWHVDPERDGSDDSCDWFNRRRKYSEAEKKVREAIWDLETILDNRPFYPDHPAHKRFQSLKEATYQLGKKKRFRIHPRWHIWHWSIQIHPLQKFKRRMFSRCNKCGGRFEWGESVLGTSWHGTGPLWFRSESDIQHMSCAGVSVATGAGAEA